MFDGKARTTTNHWGMFFTAVAGGIGGGGRVVRGNMNAMSALVVGNRRFRPPLESAPRPSITMPTIICGGTPAGFGVSYQGHRLSWRLVHTGIARQYHAGGHCFHHATAIYSCTNIRHAVNTTLLMPRTCI